MRCKLFANLSQFVTECSQFVSDQYMTSEIAKWLKTVTQRLRMLKAQPLCGWPKGRKCLFSYTLGVCRFIFTQIWLISEIVLSFLAQHLWFLVSHLKAWSKWKKIPPLWTSGICSFHCICNLLSIYCDYCKIKNLLGSMSNNDWILSWTTVHCYSSLSVYKVHVFIAQSVHLCFVCN